MSVLGNNVGWTDRALEPRRKSLSVVDGVMSELVIMPLLRNLLIKPPYPMTVFFTAWVGGFVSDDQYRPVMILFPCTLSVHPLSIKQQKQKVLKQGGETAALVVMNTCIFYRKCYPFF